MTISAELPAPVAQFLGNFVGRSRRLRFIGSVGIAACALIAWAILCCIVDRFARLPATARAALLAIGVAASLCLVVRAALLSRRRPNWVAVAIAAERVNPRFAQKLVTITSQSLARADQRGSDQILARLIDDVLAGIRSKEPTRAPGVGAAIAPWLAVLVSSIFIAAGLGVSSLHGSQLAVRFFQPFAGIPPVTTTQLRVLPGDANVVQSQPLNIRVEAVNTGDATPNLLLQSGGESWTTLPMTSNGDGSFVATVASVDRDQRYCVACGDARSADYKIRVLRQPAVARFDLLYEYPPYTRLPPGSFHNDDGRIEAPVGTRVTVTITATEPLRQAALVANGERMAMTIGSPPTTARVQLAAQSNQEYTIEMVSDRGVAGSTATPSTIRVLPDLPPQARMLRGGDSLRLNPRDIIPVSYDALDDFGIVSLDLQAEVNGSVAMTMPLRRMGDARRQQDTISFDLAKLQLAYGDVLTLTLIATDTGGHEARAMPLQALITPRVVDLDAYQRVVELEHADQLQLDLVSQLDRAGAQITAARTQPSLQPASGRFDREVSGAIQSAATLKQTLLRAITHADEAKFSVVVANWIDTNETIVNSLQDLFRRRGGPTSQPADFGALHEAQSSAEHLGVQIKTLLNAKRGQALQSDLENLTAARSRPMEKDENARQRAAQTLERMRQEIDDEARQLRLAADSRELSEQVQQIVDAGNGLLAEARPVKFSAAATAWAQALLHDSTHRAGFEARLSAAAQAEAVRPDADFVHARDLELASRAVAMTRASSTVDASTLAAIAGAIRTLADRSERIGGLHPATLPATDLMTLGAARTVLRRAAGELDERRPDTDGLIEGQKDLESLAIAANAASASREYQKASDIESQMYRRLRTRFRRDRGPVAKSQPADDGQGVLPDRIERRRQAAQRETDAAKRLDDLDQRQLVLSQSTGGDPVELAQRQSGVADELASIARPDGQSDASTPDGRDRATSEVMAGIELLATMPQALADAQDAAVSRRSASHRAKLAGSAAAHGPADQRAVLQRVSQGADQSEKEAIERLTRAAAPLLPATVQELAQRLGAYAPETDAARDMILVRLAPVLADLQESLAGDDPDDTDRASGEALDAISAAQRELAASRDLLMRRDPLAAARSFARMAAESLSASPPNLSGAKRHQAGVFESLSRAWDQSIHRAAQQRLASIPSMSAVLGSPIAGESDATSRPADRFSTARQWDRMRSDDDASLDASLHDSEPAGYEQSLKLYFEALGRGQERK